MDRQGHRPVPSRRATERLSDGVGHDIDGLRRSLTDALAEADRLERDGRTDLAVQALEDQRAVLAAVHDRLMHRVSDAAVEREAEAVVAAFVPEHAGLVSTGDLSSRDLDGELAQLLLEEAAAPSLDVEHDGPSSSAPLDPTHALHGEDRRSMAGRVLASALAAVLGVVLLTVNDPETGVITIAAYPYEAGPVGGPGTGSAAAAAQSAAATSAVAPTPDGNDTDTASALPVERPTSVGAGETLADRAGDDGLDAVLSPFAPNPTSMSGGDVSNVLLPGAGGGAAPGTAADDDDDEPDGGQTGVRGTGPDAGGPAAPAAPGDAPATSSPAGGDASGPSTSAPVLDDDGAARLGPGTVAGDL